MQELIDTLWNVNLTYTGRWYETDERINRYIMECKYTLDTSCNQGIFGINRYIMECKCQKGRCR